MAAIGDCACLYKSISDIILRTIAEEIARSNTLKKVLQNHKVPTVEIDSYIGNLDEVLDIIKLTPICKTGLLKIQAQVKPAAKSEEELAQRTLPTLWGTASFVGAGKEAGLTGDYDSPGALAKALNIKTRGAKDMTVAFRRAGFEVRGNGEDVEKGTTNFIVKRIGPTDRKWLTSSPSRVFPAPTRVVRESSEAERPAGFG